MQVQCYLPWRAIDSFTAVMGENMSNTIELLETIGSDASLRYTSSENLTRVLIAQQASEGLKQAVCLGDKSHLVQELGPRTDPLPPNSPTTGGCGEGESDDTDEDRPGRGDDSDDREAKLDS